MSMRTLGRLTSPVSNGIGLATAWVKQVASPAQPVTIVGSIGVVFRRYDPSGPQANNRIGIRAHKGW